MTFHEPFSNPQESESETNCLTCINPIRKPRAMNRWSLAPRDHETREKQDLDREFAAKMNSLSLVDREIVLEELHGVKSAKRSTTSSFSSISANPRNSKKYHQSETTSSSESSAESMHPLIDAMQNLQKHLVDMKRGTAYERVEIENPAYVSNIDFRLMFLRANSFDVKATATQMIRHLDLKQSLFGKEKLTKDITLNDLDGDDRNFLEQGSLQVLPCDSAGREIFLCFKGLGAPKSLESELRVMFYIVMTMCETEEKQKKGGVKILYLVEDFKAKSNENFPKHGELFMATPMDWKGIHVCNDDYKQYLLLSTVMHLMPPKQSAKFRVHFGSHTECLYNLRSYGIGNGIIPINPKDNSPVFHHHKVWLNDRVIRDNEKEMKRLGKKSQPAEVASLAHDRASPDTQAKSLSDSSMTDAIVEIQPRPQDMLFGKEYKFHPGNARLHAIVVQHELEYDDIEGKKDKIAFVGRIVHDIQATGTRFLIFDEATKQWKLVPIKEARNKISKAIRNRRRTRES
ncbi:unnamed protein product [Cylindrotheca closterium]|uniref:CRAL-TRIO domain-containing protein n=1 Tax=Cylindrotheca closterium TaxID=2856 RepID=A0AAD2JJK3_9STRA|nr:unnamed protein product [Cylindrotheca closterium]